MRLSNPPLVPMEAAHFTFFPMVALLLVSRGVGRLGDPVRAAPLGRAPASRHDG
jgi:hypothetical protein